jgi:hypothetical protein
LPLSFRSSAFGAGLDSAGFLGDSGAEGAFLVGVGLGSTFCSSCFSTGFSTDFA